MWYPYKKQLEEHYQKQKEELIARLQKQTEEASEYLQTQLKSLDKSIQEAKYEEEAVAKRKADLERTNQDLKEQIRIIEAKSSPSAVWESAFSLGFSKAWDMMLPHMVQGLDKLKETIREQEIEASLSRLTPMLEQRLTDLRDVNLKTTHELTEKRKQFVVKMQRSQDREEIRKYENFIVAIDWALGEANGN